VDDGAVDLVCRYVTDTDAEMSPRRIACVELGLRRVDRADMASPNRWRRVVPVRMYQACSHVSVVFACFTELKHTLHMATATGAFTSVFLLNNTYACLLYKIRSGSSCEIELN